MEAVNRFFESRKLTGSIVILVVSAVLASLLALFSELRFTSYPGFTDPIDHHKYIYMAQHPFNFFIAPFCWRVGLPLLAGILPFDLQTNFLTLTYLSVVFSGLILFYFVRKLGFSSFYSLVGVLLFYAAGWIVRMPLINFWVPNAAVFLVILCCLYMIAAKKDIAFMVLLAIGVCVKESALFVAPLYYTFNCRKIIDWRAATRTILLALPAVGVLILLHYVLLPAQNANPDYVNSLPFILTQVQNGTAEYNMAYLFRTIAAPQLQNLSLSELAEYSIYPFGALLMGLPFFAIRRSLGWLAKFWPFIILVFCQTLLAVSRIGLLYLALPVMVVLAVTGMKEVAQRLAIPAILVLLLPIITFILNLNKIDDNIDFKWLALALALWLALVWMINRLQHSEKTTGEAQ
jgi:hypothetical protein